MTRNQLERLVRSIAYRRRLKRDLAKLEGELISFMQVESLTQVVTGSYKIQLDGGDLIVEEVEVEDSNLNQLEFDFEEELENERSDQIERQVTRS